MEPASMPTGRYATSFDSGKMLLPATGAALPTAFQRSVSVEQEVYTHIELGAGNYNFELNDFSINDEQKINWWSSTNKNKAHPMFCSCEGCSFDSNHYRFSVLAATLDDIVIHNPSKEVHFFINDINNTSCNQAYKYLCTHLSNTFPNHQGTIKIKELPGDFYTLKLSKYNPQSVHLKNPDNFFFYDLKNNFHLKSIHLLQECTSTDEGGLTLVTNIHWTEHVSTLLITNKRLTSQTSKLNYDASYHSPRPRVDDLYHKPAFTCILSQVATSSGIDCLEEEKVSPSPLPNH